MILKSRFLGAYGSYSHEISYYLLMETPLLYIWSWNPFSKNVANGCFNLFSTLYHTTNQISLTSFEVKSSHQICSIQTCTAQSSNPTLRSLFPSHCIRPKHCFVFSIWFLPKKKKISDFCSFWAGRQLPTEVSHDNTWQASCLTSNKYESTTISTWVALLFLSK